MKSIFFANCVDNIHYVYSQEAKERLKSLTEIDTEAVYSQEDLLANPEKFKDVEYIFSTWSMPGGVEDKDDFAKYFPKLKGVFYAAGSVKYFAQHFLDKGIKVYSAFAANAIPVAEFAAAQIILANKGYFQALNLTKAGHYNEARELSLAHVGNYNSNVGIIGAGMIGRRVIRLLRHIKVNVFVYDAFLRKSHIRAMNNSKKATLEEIFANCDVVSNHMANVPATVGMIKEEHFAMMKPNAVFINTGRGAQVDEEGMIRVLRKRPDICALLDVTIDEPPKPDSELFKLPNVFLSPHIAGSQSNEVERMADLIVDEFEAFINDKPTKYEITAEMLAKMA